MKDKVLPKILVAVFTGLLAVILSGCDTVPVTGRSQLNLMSPNQEMQLGLTSFDQLKKDTPISHDPAANALVQKVGHRIAAVADKDMPGAQWEFVVFDSKEANAFCLPGGKVGVYTGILQITKDEAGLATVITRTAYTDDHDFSGALTLLPDLGQVSVPLLRHWHETAYGSDNKS